MFFFLFIWEITKVLKTVFPLTYSNTSIGFLVIISFQLRAPVKQARFDLLLPGQPRKCCTVSGLLHFVQYPDLSLKIFESGYNRAHVFVYIWFNNVEALLASRHSKSPVGNRDRRGCDHFLSFNTQSQPDLKLLNSRTYAWFGLHVGKFFDE